MTPTPEQNVLRVGKIVGVLITVVACLGTLVKGTVVVNNFIHIQEGIIARQDALDDRQAVHELEMTAIREVNEQSLHLLDLRKRNKEDAWSRRQMGMFWSDYKKASGELILPDVYDVKYDPKD